MDGRIRKDRQDKHNRETQMDQKDRPSPSVMAHPSRRTFLTSASAVILAGTIGLGAARPAMAQAAPAKGGRIVIGFAGKGVRGFTDPHRSGDDVTGHLNQGVVFEGLTWLENDGTMSNRLAESVEAEDDTATKWIIRIKPGVKFHNGKELDAGDVIFSLKRIREDGTVSRGYLGPITAYEAIDPLTVRVTLESPRNWFPVALSGAFSGIVPADYDENNPVGTGPFRIAGQEQAQSMTLARFDDYHGTPALLDEVEIRPFADESALLNGMYAGQVDVVTNIDASLADETEGNADFVLYNSPTGKCFPIHMRADVEPFKENALRQAMRLVLDREAVINSAYNGYATKADDLYAPYDPNYDKALVRERDVAKARALVDDAGLTGTSVDLVMYDDVATALILAENAKEIGIEVKVTQLEAANFFNEEFTERKFHGGDYYPPMPFFMTSSLIDGPNPGLPTLKWVDEEYIGIWQAANASHDAADVAAKTKQLQQILFERGAWIIPVFVNELGFYKAGLTGFPEFDQNGTGMYRALPKIGFTA